MVVDCSSFVDLTSCALTLDNLYNIKITTLTILLIYSILMYFVLKQLNPEWKEKSYMHFWSFWTGKVLSIGYIFFCPLLFTLLLNHTIQLEVFLIMIVAFYFLLVALFIGMAIYIGSSEIFKMFGYDDWNEFKDSMQDKKSMKKYG